MMNMSLDGYITGPNRTPDNPMGDDGMLHQFVFAEDAASQALVKAATDEAGVSICGRRTYDDSIRWWGANGPTGDLRLPVIVVTHEAPKDAPEGSVYTFVTEGIHHALELAKAAANDKDIGVSGTADVGIQFLNAGLVDEISLYVSPVLFGDGVRMFERLDKALVKLEPLFVVHTPAVTNLRYRVVK